ncbi:MAG: peptidoglycan recognition family protein [Phycisphaeraceae bacterium]
MLLASLGLFVAGCGTPHGSSIVRPRTQWPGAIARPRQDRTATVEPAPRRSNPAATPPRPASDGLAAIPRSRWASTGPVDGRVNPLNGVARITVHHEGWTSFFHTDENTTADRIEQIRQVHVRDRGWGDIGYHYIIDRAGRAWQCRSLRYQGAHVANNNENNLGVMLLGNFDKQTPSSAQIDCLVATLRSLMATHRVPTHRVYTHQELSPSACPGRNLQPRVVSLRQGGHLA